MHFRANMKILFSPKSALSTTTRRSTKYLTTWSQDIQISYCRLDKSNNCNSLKMGSPSNHTTHERSRWLVRPTGCSRITDARFKWISVGMFGLVSCDGVRPEVKAFTPKCTDLWVQQRYMLVEVDSSDLETQSHRHKERLNSPN